MSYMQTHELVKETLVRIDDYLYDPEPVYDELIQKIPPHVLQQLWFACKTAYQYMENDLE